MECKHIDYDDYFEVCNDCGKSGAHIHATECVPAGDWHITDDGACSRCGTLTDSFTEQDEKEAA